MKKSNCLQFVQTMESQQIENGTLVERLNNYKKMSLKKYAQWLSKETGESFSPHEALYGTHAILTLLLSVFTIEMPLLVRILAFIWFGISVYQCKHIGD